MSKWIVRTNPTKYPDLFTYDILEKNPDAGKSGVPYSGEYMTIASGMDGKKDALLMAGAPEMLAAIRQAMNLLREVVYEYPADYTPEFVARCKEIEEKLFEAIPETELVNANETLAKSESNQDEHCDTCGVETCFFNGEKRTPVHGGCWEQPSCYASDERRDINGHTL